MSRQRKIGRERRTESSVGPALADNTRGLIFSRRVADRYLTIARFAFAAGLLEFFDQVAFGCGRDHSVRDPSRELRRARFAGGDHNRRRFLGESEYPRLLHR